MIGRAAAHLRKDEQIREMHNPKNHQHTTDFAAQDFESSLGIYCFVAVSQSERNKADVYQVEADDQEVIDRIRQRLVSQKTVHEEDAAVFVQRPGHPDGQGDAYREVNGVGPEGGRGVGNGFNRSEGRYHKFLSISPVYLCIRPFCHYRTSINLVPRFGKRQITDPADLTLYGSAPLQLTVNRSLLSGDVDLFSDDDEDLAAFVEKHGLGKETGGIYLEPGYESFLSML